MNEKFQTWWWFTFKNPVIRKGESGGFKWCFRRLTLDISTVSGNFKARFTAAEHPYAYLLSGKTNDNIVGFCEMLYSIGMLLTTDSGFVNDIGKAIQKYDKRIQKANPTPADDETEEKIAIEEVKQVQEYVDADPKERKKKERDANGRFKKAVRNLQEEPEKQ